MMTLHSRAVTATLLVTALLLFLAGCKGGAINDNSLTHDVELSGRASMDGKR